MATQILAIAAGAASSSDITVSAGTPLAVSLKGTSGVLPAGCRVTVLLKDDGGNYQPVGALNSSQPAQTIIGPGLYRFDRSSDSPACGVFSG